MNGKQIIERLTQEIEELTKSPWISVEDELPPVHEEVIVFDGEVRGGYMLDPFGDFVDVTHEYSNLDDVTHWMPKPKGPQQ